MRPSKRRRDDDLPAATMDEELRRRFLRQRRRLRASMGRDYYDDVDYEDDGEPRHPSHHWNNVKAGFHFVKDVGAFLLSTRIFAALLDMALQLLFVLVMACVVFVLGSLSIVVSAFSRVCSQGGNGRSPTKLALMRQTVDSTSSFVTSLLDKLERDEREEREELASFDRATVLAIEDCTSSERAERPTPPRVAPKPSVLGLPPEPPPMPTMETINVEKAREASPMTLQRHKSLFGSVIAEIKRMGGGDGRGD